MKHRGKKQLNESVCTGVKKGPQVLHLSEVMRTIANMGSVDFSWQDMTLDQSNAIFECLRNEFPAKVDFVHRNFCANDRGDVTGVDGQDFFTSAVASGYLNDFISGVKGFDFDYLHVVGEMDFAMQYIALCQKMLWEVESIRSASDRLRSNYDTGLVQTLFFARIMSFVGPNRADLNHAELPVLNEAPCRV